SRLTLGGERGRECLATSALRSNLRIAARVAGPRDPPKIPFRTEGSDADGDGTGSYRHIGTQANPASLTGQGTDLPRESSPDEQSRAALLPGYSWDEVRSQLGENAGFYLRRAEVNSGELVLHGNQTRYLYMAESVGRGARVLDNVVDPGIEWFTFEYNRQDM